MFIRGENFKNIQISYHIHFEAYFHITDAFHAICLRVFNSTNFIVFSTVDGKNLKFKLQGFFSMDLIKHSDSFK